MKRMIAGLLVCAALSAAAQTPRMLQAPVWVYLETVPGGLSAEEIAAKLPPIQELDETARFILAGMLYGWHFSYTPSDKTRKVDEFFEMTPIGTIERGDRRMVLTAVKPEYPRLSAWAEFTLDDSLARWSAYWSSVLFKSANGRGRGERAAEAAGIRTAYTDAVRDAVREYARKLEKNKPKEIRGEVLLREGARLFADEGRFVADIRVLVNLQEVVPYRTF